MTTEAHSERIIDPTVPVISFEGAEHNQSLFPAFLQWLSDTRKAIAQHLAVNKPQFPRSKINHAQRVVDSKQAEVWNGLSIEEQLSLFLTSLIPGIRVLSTNSEIYSFQNTLLREGTEEIGISQFDMVAYKDRDIVGMDLNKGLLYRLSGSGNLIRQIETGVSDFYSLDN